MQKEVLELIARRLRYQSIFMTSVAGSGHPTSCLSSADIMACLFFDEMRYNIKDSTDLSNDEFVLSKGHASALLWACYAEAGIIPFKKLDDYRKFGSPLEGHPTPNMPWVKFASGSLGQGLSVGLGMSIALTARKSNARVYVLLGDGECAEGSVWESVALAKKLDVQNLVAIVDCNRLGQSGESLHGEDISKWRAKFIGFGWNVFVIDGHDISQITGAFAQARATHGPNVILAKTIKGKGISFLENKEGWHGKALSEDDVKRAFAELGPLPDIDSKKFVRSPPKSQVSKFKIGVPAHPKYKLNDLFSTREAFGVMLEKLGVDERIFVLDCDVKNSTFTDKFLSFYKERFVEGFIAEQNAVGMCIGLACKGFVPFFATFASFLTRAHDQIRMAGISRSNIKLIGSHVGVSIGEDGPSQMGLEDLAMMRCIPNSVVLYPCDAVSSEYCTELLSKTDCISYLRVSRPKLPVIYDNKESFKIGGSKTILRSFRDKFAIICAGVTVHEALKAAKELRKNKIYARVIDAYSIKPLDASIKSLAKKMKIIVVEDHYAEGGLGEAVSSLGIPITHLCIRDIPRSGSCADLLEAYGIDYKAIIRSVKKL